MITIADYKPSAPALQSDREDARVKYAWGPLGTGKTSWLCWRFYRVALRATREEKAVRGILIRDTYRNLEDSTLKTFLEWFPDGVAGTLKTQQSVKDFHLNLRIEKNGKAGPWITHELLFRHGQTARDASSFLSTEYAFIGLEEIAPIYLPSGQVSPGIAEEVLDAALMRLSRSRTRGVDYPELCMSSNPPPTYHWGNTRILSLTPAELAEKRWTHYFFARVDNEANLRADYYSDIEKSLEGKEDLQRRFLRGEIVAIFIGVPRFKLEALQEMKERALEPSFRGWLTPEKGNIFHVKPEENSEGYVRMWESPKAGRRYVIGADAAAGLAGRDFSSAHVLDGKDLTLCASFHGHLEPSKFADELAKLGFLYNQALIGVETEPSAHGLTTATRLRDEGNPRLYYSKRIDSRTRKPQQRLGWVNDRRTKPMMIDNLADYLDEGHDVVDAETIGELMTYGVMDNGELAAQEGCFDDRVISYALALMLRQHVGMSRVYSSLG